MKDKKTLNITIVSGVVAILLIVAFIFTVIKQSNGDGAKIMANFEKYFNSKERTVIYYASSQCGYCKLETPILETIAEDYDMDYLDIDSTKLTKEQREEILDKLEIEQSTPTTVIVEKGKVIDTQVGYVAGKEYVEFFKNAGVIPEDAIYSKEQYITDIDYLKFEELLNEGTHVVVIGQTGCSHCTAIKPALNTVAKDYKVTINYLNITDMDNSTQNNFSEKLKEIDYNDPDFLEEGSYGTPLTLIIKDGKVISYLSGERTTSQLAREFKKQGLIS